MGADGGDVGARVAVGATGGCVGTLVAVGAGGGCVGALVEVGCGAVVLVGLDVGVAAGWPLQIVPTRLGSMYLAISLVWKEGIIVVTSVPHFWPLCGLDLLPFSYTCPP